MTDNLEKKVLMFSPSLRREDKEEKALLIDVLKDWAGGTRILGSEPLRNDVFDYLKKHDKSLVTWHFQYGALPEFSFEDHQIAKYTHELHRKASANPKIMSVLHYSDIEKFES